MEPEMSRKDEIQQKYVKREDIKLTSVRVVNQYVDYSMTEDAVFAFWDDAVAFIRSKMPDDDRIKYGYTKILGGYHFEIVIDRRPE